MGSGESGEDGAIWLRWTGFEVFWSQASWDEVSLERYA
jgi:hypothetical protein